MSPSPAPHFSAAFARAGAVGQPLSAGLELTYVCNWRCVFCYNPRHHDEGGLSGDEWIGVLDELRILGTLWIALTGGDALAHPEFLRIAQAVRERAFGLRVFTNGTLVNDEMARRIARLDPISVELSVHGPTADLHDRVTGKAGSFEAMLAGLDRLRNAGARVVLKSPLTRLNVNLLDEVLALASGRSVELRIDTSITPRDDGNLAPTAFRASADDVERVFSRLQEIGQLRSVDRTPGGTNCGIGRSTLTIDPEGHVFPCMQWRHRALGNVRQTPLRQLWHSSPVRKEAAGISLAANDALLAAGAPLSNFHFCPALALQETGDALTPSRTHVALAEAAARVRERGA